MKTHAQKLAEELAYLERRRERLEAELAGVNIDLGITKLLIAAEENRKEALTATA